MNEKGPLGLLANLKFVNHRKERLKKSSLKVNKALVTLAGILTVISAFIASWVGYVLINFNLGLGPKQLVDPISMLFIGIFNLFGSIFGLFSGCLILVRKNLAVSVIGAGWLMVGGMIVAASADGGGLLWGCNNLLRF